MKGTEFKKRILRRYVANQANEREIEALRHLMANGELDEELDQVAEEVWAASAAETAKPERKAKIPFRRWGWVSAAAAVLVLGLYLTGPGLAKLEIFRDRLQGRAAPVLPGKNTAVLTLSNGKSIALSSEKSGVVLGNEGLRYNDGDSVAISSSEIIEDAVTTISTPRGGTYRVVLSDGSSIQLNAASSISFDADFRRLPVRMVRLSGEAYFEVTGDKDKSFVVVSRNQRVEVLGTRFNVSAYGDEDYTLTTLLEGAVNINETVLAPNEQAKQVGGRVTVRKIDPLAAVGWKDGEFVFDNEPLEGIMKKVSRWYDVEVSYESDNLRQKTFSGSLSRYARVEELLNALRYAGIQTRMGNRKIYIVNELSH